MKKFHPCDRKIILSFQISEMEQLKNMIRDAANQFQCHNFNTALTLYERCLEKCEGINHPKYVLHNLKSSVAALHTILGNLDEAQSILNAVLKEEKQHWLCLMRRSQVYKKKHEFKKALKDLDVLAMFAPDNLQVAALKLEIKGLMSKGNQSSSDEEKSSDSELDEEKMLNFSNLRKIDRTSVSIMLPRNRQSRVTLLGDVAFEYAASDDEDNRISVNYTPKLARQKYIQIQKELEEDTQEQSIDKIATPSVKVKNPERSKSILKNRDSKLYIQKVSEKKKNDSGEKLIDRLQDVDGKVITSETNSDKSISSKEVVFRKSITFQAALQKEPKPSGFQPSKKKQRKSCLKRTSFDINVEEINKKGPRRSKFDLMKRSSIDGKMIPSQQPKTPEKEKQESDDEQGSEYNIFGNQKIELTKEMRENLGLDSEEKIKEKDAKKGGRGKSILKTSMAISKKVADNSEAEKPKKAKKSVMFKS